MENETEISRLILLEEFGGIVFCRSCGMAIGYINDKGYKKLNMGIMCGCGCMGAIRLEHGRAKKSGNVTFSKKNPDIINNVFICEECNTPMFEIDGERVENCSFEVVCNCGMYYKGKNTFFQRLFETAQYLKRKRRNQETT